MSRVHHLVDHANVHRYQNFSSDIIDRFKQSRLNYKVHTFLTMSVDFSTYLEIATRVLDAKGENIWHFSFNSVDTFDSWLVTLYDKLVTLYDPPYLGRFPRSSAISGR